MDIEKQIRNPFEMVSVENRGFNNSIRYLALNKKLDFGGLCYSNCTDKSVELQGTIVFDFKKNDGNGSEIFDESLIS